MLWQGRPYGCDSWLPEDKKVVAYGRLPYPARRVQDSPGIIGYWKLLD